MPGAISPATGARQERQLDVAERPAAATRTSKRGSARPVRLANDANCFALSEASDGAGAGAETVFGVIIGTGVRRRRRRAGPRPDGPERDRRRVGPQPAAVAARRRAARARRATAASTAASRRSSPGPGSRATTRRAPARDVAAREIVARARRWRRGRAAPTLDRYEERLARGLATVVNVLDPDVIVLGGGMSNVDAAVPERPGAACRDYVFSDRVDTRIVPPKHGDSSGVRGAAWLWPADRL